MHREKSSSSLKTKDSGVGNKPRRSVSILHLAERENGELLHRHSSVDKLPNLLRTGIRTGQKMSREYSEGVEGGLWRVASGEHMELSVDVHPAPLAVHTRSPSRGPRSESRANSRANSRTNSRANSRAPHSRIHSRLALNLDQNVLDDYPIHNNVFLRTPGADEPTDAQGNQTSTFFIDATDNYDSDDEEYDYVFNPNNDDEILLRTHIDRYKDDEDQSSKFSRGLYRTFAKIMDKIAGIDDKTYDLTESIVAEAGDNIKMLHVSEDREPVITTNNTNATQTISSRQARLLVRDEDQKQREDLILVLGAIEHIFT